MKKKTLVKLDAILHSIGAYLSTPLKIALKTTGAFLLGFIPFYAVFDPYWLSIALGRESKFPNIVGAFVGAILLAFPLFFPYFFVTENLTVLIARSTKKKSTRTLIYFLMLSPFFIFNLLAYLFVAEDWTGQKFILDNYVLFLLGFFSIILPTTGAFIYFNEKYYKQYQKKYANHSPIPPRTIADGRRRSD